MSLHSPLTLNLLVQSSMNSMKPKPQRAAYGRLLSVPLVRGAEPQRAAYGRPLVRGAVVLALSLLPALAAAQESPAVAAPVKDRQSVTFNEVERGVFLGARAGANFLVNAPFKGPFSPGEQAGVEFGVDIGGRLALGLGVSFSANRANGTYTGKSGGAASGDFSMVVPAASLRVNLVGLSDGQDVQRTHLYVRGGAGYVLFAPKALLPTSDILVFAGPGVEYYTRLRHFSIGLEVTGSYLLSSASIGFAVMPSVRYAF